MASERGHPAFPYHYGFEAESYTFYRVPKALFTEPEFKALSTDARLLYGLMLDRMQLSIRNGWADEEGRIFISYTVDSIMADLSCGNKKAGQLLAELDDKKGIGLISRVRQGQGKPDRIYVRKCITPDMSKRHFKTCQKDISGDVETTCQDVSKAHANNTEKNKTEINKTDPIESYPSKSGECTGSTHGKTAKNPWSGGGFETDSESESDGMDRMGYLKYFEESLSLDILRIDLPMQKEQLEEIKELLAETCSSHKEYIRINGDDRPAEEVRERLMSLDSEHIRYVLESLSSTTSRVRNIRQYLLTALYNAPMTMNSYYDALVRHDLYGEGGR